MNLSTYDVVNFRDLVLEGGKKAKHGQAARAR